MMTKTIQKIGKVFLYSLNAFVFAILTKIVRRKKNRILFGSWMGKLYADNTKYIFEYLMAYKHLELVWCGNENIKKVLPKADNIIFVRKGSLKAIYYCLTSKYIFVSQGLQADLTVSKVFEGAIVTHLWHGVPLKRIGLDISGTKKRSNTLLRRWTKYLFEEKYDYFVSASQVNSNIFISAFSNIGATSTNMIPSGTPRNDILVNATDDKIKELKLKYKKMLGIPLEKRLVTYLPTYRRKNNNIFTFSQLSNEDNKKLETLLQNENGVLLEKNHFVTYERNNILANRSDLVIKMDQSQQMEIDVQELLLATDVLISDYSGCYLDFVLLDRPIIHFVYDYDYYKNVDSGLYFELEEVAAGPIVKTFDELLFALEEAFKFENKYNNERQKVRNTYMQYEQGRASEIIVSKVMGLSKNEKEDHRDVAYS